MIEWLAGLLAGLSCAWSYDAYARPALRRRTVRREGLSWQCPTCPFSITMLPKHGGPTAGHLADLDRVIAAHRRQVHA